LRPRRRCRSGGSVPLSLVSAMKPSRDGRRSALGFAGTRKGSPGKKSPPRRTAAGVLLGLAVRHCCWPASQ
jgi:hypothetical protein